MIVFTANQGWFSRIYVMDMNGSVLTYHEYEYYIFSDLEVVDNEVYVTDWVAPRLYKVDPLTGDLEVIIDDWNLLSMYDVAWDGNHFYIDEWSLNRYDLQGDWQGSASSPGSVRGSAWDGDYYWTLDSNGQISCWDLSSWPTLQEIPANAFSSPTPRCKGLWFDGKYFWTAESGETLGQIYRFDHQGQVIAAWQEPAFSGYAACKVSGPMTASGTLVDGELMVQWIPHPDAAAYWIYGAENEPFFTAEIPWPHANRITMLRPGASSWSSSMGAGIPSANWTYTIVAMDDQGQAILESNRVGEFDLSTDIP